MRQHTTYKLAKFIWRTIRKIWQ